MKPELVLEYFPLVSYFGKNQSFQASRLVQRLDLIPKGTYVWKSLGQNTIGRTTQEVDPMKSAENLLKCRILRLDGIIIAPSENRFGHFFLLDAIPLLDEVIKEFETELRVAGY